MKRPDAAKAVFVLSVALLIFAAGATVGHYKLFPYSIVSVGVKSLRQVWSERVTLTGKRPLDLTRPARHQGSGVTRHLVGAAAPGLTLISSVFDKVNEIRLIHLDGSVVHRWPVEFFKIFPNPDHLEERLRPKSEWNTYADGAIALPDGSIVFHFGYLGMAKLDRCGKVQWTLPQSTHHSIVLSGDGGFWIGSGSFVTEKSPFPLLKPPYFSNTLVRVSADGMVAYEKSVLELFFANNLEALLFSNGLDGIGVASEDLTHLNDVEELSAEMANRFPAFAAGDLLLSLRNLNLLMVVDPQTGKVKWNQTGPWLNQHDPDFEPDGKISVYSNNNDGTSDGGLLGGSQIMEVDPSTGETEIRYGGKADQKWYSATKGRQQSLPNGNVLIVSSDEGRVLEVDDKGAIVWEFINRYDEEYVSIVWSGSRYSEDYFTVKDWTCGP